MSMINLFREAVVHVDKRPLQYSGKVCFTALQPVLDVHRQTVDDIVSRILTTVTVKYTKHEQVGRQLTGHSPILVRRSPTAETGHTDVVERNHRNELTSPNTFFHVNLEVETVVPRTQRIEVDTASTFACVRRVG
jgi:predicted transposase YdaD